MADLPDSQAASSRRSSSVLVRDPAEAAPADAVTKVSLVSGMRRMHRPRSTPTVASPEDNHQRHAQPGERCPEDEENRRDCVHD